MFEYVFYVATLTGILSLAVLGIQIQLGRIGLLNLGHIALFGMGAYVCMSLYNGGLSLAACLAAGLLQGAVIGTLLMVLGNPLKPEVFSLASFGFLEAVQSLAMYLKGITGGASGLVLANQPGVSVGSLFWISLIVSLMVFYGIVSGLARSKVGLVWHGIKEREVLAQSLGFATYKYKLLVAGVAGGCSGLAGAFLGIFVSYVDPSIFSVTYLIQQLTMATVSGIGSIGNTLLGAFSLTGVTEGLRFLPISSGYMGPLRQLFYALMLLAILAFGARLAFKRNIE